MKPLDSITPKLDAEFNAAVDKVGGVDIARLLLRKSKKNTNSSVKKTTKVQKKYKIYIQSVDGDAVDSIITSSNPDYPERLKKFKTDINSNKGYIQIYINNKKRGIININLVKKIYDIMSGENFEVAITISDNNSDTIYQKTDGFTVVI